MSGPAQLDPPERSRLLHHQREGQILGLVRLPGVQRIRQPEIEVAVLGVEKNIPDVASFARGLVYGSPVIDQIRERSGVEPDRIVETLADALGREFGADPARMPMQAITFKARKR